MRNRTDEALGLLLGHSQSDVLLAITGVFVNLSADEQCRYLLLKPTANTLQIYAELLRRVSFKDIHLATLICQVWTGCVIHHQSMNVTHAMMTMPSPPSLQVIHNLISSKFSSVDSSSSFAPPLSTDLSDYVCDTLLELSDCASDLKSTSTGDDSYAVFESVSRSVMSILDGIAVNKGQS